MKRHRVKMTAIARVEALQAAMYIAERSPLNSARWQRGFEQAIRRLSVLPKAYARAPESIYFDADIRQVVYKSHRILFTVMGDVVFVLRIRHGARLRTGQSHC